MIGMKKKIFPVSMAVLWGIVFTTSLHNLTIGICLGIMMGIAFGLFDSDKETQYNKEEKEDV